MLIKTVDPDQTDHPCAGRMRTAAGADIAALHSNDPQRTGQLLILLAHHQLRQPGMRQITDRDRLVLPDLTVGIIFGLRQLSCRQLFIKIDSHQPLAHMKTNVIGAKQLPHCVRKDMLASMLLHMVQPGLPVQHRLDLRASRQRLLAVMQHFAVTLSGIGHLHAAQSAQVAQLTASLREKDRPVQNNGITAPGLLTALHRRQAAF